MSATITVPVWPFWAIPAGYILIGLLLAFPTLYVAESSVERIDRRGMFHRFRWWLSPLLLVAWPWNLWEIGDDWKYAWRRLRGSEDAS